MNILCDNRIFCLGTDALRLYAEIHQSNANQILHGLGMPFVGYAIFGGVPAAITTYMNPRYISLNPAHTKARIRCAIYLIYVLYYCTFDLLGGVVTAITYILPLVHATRDKNSRSLWYYVCVMATSIAVQEGIGHTFAEHANSDLWQLPNSISISPLFGTRALLHNIFGLPLVEI